MSAMNESKMATARQRAAERLSSNSNNIYITSAVMKILYDLYKQGWDDATESANRPAPVAIGTIVDYRGSLGYMHGRYRVTGFEATTGPNAERYSDGVKYNLWEVGVPEKYGLRDHSLSQVRRDSFTIVTAACESCGQAQAPAVVDPYLADVEGIVKVRRLCDRCFDKRKDDY